MLGWRVIEYVYDNRNQLTTELWKTGGSTVRTLTFAYDLLGHLIAASDPAADYAFQVDALGNVWEETHDLAALSFDIELDRTFDWLERQTELKTYFGTTADQKTSFTYDSYSRVTNVYQQGVSGGNTVAARRC